MRVNGIFVEAPTSDRTDKGSPDILITALEALGAPEGNHALLKVTS
jgi:hypothetical protein